MATTFSFVDYLAAKKSVDDRALNRQVLDAVVANLPADQTSRPLQVLEVAAGIGAVWLLARVAFAVLYTKNPKKRAPAFVTSYFCLVALLGLSVYGLAVNFVS